MTFEFKPAPVYVMRTFTKRWMFFMWLFLVGLFCCCQNILVWLFCCSVINWNVPQTTWKTMVISALKVQESCRRVTTCDSVLFPQNSINCWCTSLSDCTVQTILCCWPVLENNFQERKNVQSSHSADFAHASDACDKFANAWNICFHGRIHRHSCWKSAWGLIYYFIRTEWEWKSCLFAQKRTFPNFNSGSRSIVCAKRGSVVGD